MKRVFVFGAGRVGRVMANALHDRGALAGWWTRARALEGPAASRGGHRWPEPEDLNKAEVLLLCVSDDALDRVVRALATMPLREGIVVLHTSGVRGAEALDGLPSQVARGAWHPLHAVQPEEPLSSWKGAFFAVDGDGDAVSVAENLTSWAGGVSGRIPAGARQAYHLAAVLAGNTVHAGLFAAGKVTQSAGIRGEALDAGLARLALQSAMAAAEHGVEDAATGPVVRGDLTTVQRHLGHPHLQDDVSALYRAAAFLLLEAAASRSLQVKERQQLEDWLLTQRDFAADDPASS